MKCVAIIFLAGCGGVAPEAHAANAAEAATYELELKSCADHAATIAASKYCRCEVSKRYRRPCDE